MSKRLLRWLMYTVLFALIPTIISLILQFALNSDINHYNYTAELLFFTLMVSSTTLSDIMDLNKRIGQYDILMTFFFSISLLLSIVSSILYGCSIISNIVIGVTINLNGKLLPIVVCVSVISFILGMIIQIFLSRVEVYSNG